MKNLFFILAISCVFLYGCSSIKADSNLKEHAILKVGSSYKIVSVNRANTVKILQFLDIGYVKATILSPEDLAGTTVYIRLNHIAFIQEL